MSKMVLFTRERKADGELMQDELFADDSANNIIVVIKVDQDEVLCSD